MKRLLLIAISVLVSFHLSAQNELDKRIIKTMQDELNRSIKMSLPESGKPVYVSYYVEHGEEFEIKATLGNIQSVTDQPDYVRSAVKMLLGSLEESSQLKYYGPLSPAPLPFNFDYDEMRRQLWLQTDGAYKAQSFEMADKLAHRDYGRKRERELDDWVKVAPEEVYIEREKDVACDRRQWTENIKELSAIFRDFPKIQQSDVMFRYHSADSYMTNSDGTVIKQPTVQVAIYVHMQTFDADGMPLADTRTFGSDYLKNMVSMDDLKREIRNFAEVMTSKIDAPMAKENYRGPVLILGEVPGKMFRTLVGSALVGLRNDNIVVMLGASPLDKRMNTRIIDRKITVKNITTPMTFEGRALYGSYTIDAEGVRPKSEQVLVENGIMKSVLNDRIPKLSAPGPTGSVRFGNWTFFAEQGILDVSSSETMPYDKMKKELIKLAKQQGCKCAYILRSSEWGTYTYRVDLETGEEVMEKGLITPTLDSSILNMDNYNVHAIAKERRVYDFLSHCGPQSVIAPKAIIVDDLKLSLQQFSKSGVKPIVYPLAAGSK